MNGADAVTRSIGTNTCATATIAASVNAEDSVPGRHRVPKQRYFKGFMIMLGALVAMFFALIIGTIAALAGLAGGIAGLILVGIYLISVIVLMWELLFRVPALDREGEVAAYQGAHRRRSDRDQDGADEWITDEDWVGQQGEAGQRYYGQADDVDDLPDTHELPTIPIELPTIPIPRSEPDDRAA
jgi:predicted lipid-binding transport protein (Tim44 family)